MRNDGKLIKDVSPMYLLAPYFMPERNDALNSIHISCDYDKVHNYVIAKRKEGKKISHMAVILAAYVRTVSQFKCLNRFVVHSKIYAHNTLTTCMVALRPGDGNETMGKINFDLYDTVFDVNDRIDRYIAEEAQSDSNNSLDKAMKFLVSLPGLVRFLLWLARGFDKWFCLPKGVIKASPFHGTMVFTNLASIKTNYIYHHIYNFGTENVVLAMGNTEEKVKMVKGVPTTVKEIPFGLVMDERICEGAYFAKAFAKFSEYVANPELLETPPETVEYDFPFPTLSSRFPTKKQLKEMKKQQKAENK